jgi:hypothetical protein
MEYPEDIREFMLWFKNQSEMFFSTLELDKEAYGLQHQQGTKWRKGLTDIEILDFQKEIGFDFPEILIEFYKNMNGTDIPGVNVYGDTSEYHYEEMYFSYPEHLPKIKMQINELLEIKGLTFEKMKENNVPFVFPICAFYFMVIDFNNNPIYFLSPAYKRDINRSHVHGSLWTDSLQSWLIKNSFSQCDYVSDLEEFPNRKREINYWDSSKVNPT